MAQNLDNDTDYKRYLLKKKLDILKNKKGFHTALISLFIPPGRKISDVTGYLKQEIGESSNIKSKTNRKNVIDSITALLGQLRNIKEVSSTGLIMYSGQIPEDFKPGTEKSEMYLIEPPEPLTSFKYYCASEFLLDPLYDMVSEKGTYGIINIENKEAAIGWVRGPHLEICKTFTSGIHSKHNAGGQSQRRLERLIEEGAQNFYRHVGEVANQIFLEIEGDLLGLFISGGGLSKEKFVKKGVLDYRLEEKIIDFVDVSYSGEAGVRETVIKIQDKLVDLRYIKEKRIFNEFMEHIVKDDGLATYGEKEVRAALNMGAVNKLLISESVNLRRLFLKCENCGYEEERTEVPDRISKISENLKSDECPQCKSNLYQVINEMDIVENLGAIAKDQGSQIEILSSETEGGISLFQTFGGIAAIQRFKTSSY